MIGLALVLAGCGAGGGGGGTAADPIGAERAKPGGGTFFVDPNLSRAHTAWIDTRIDGPDFRATLVSPREGEQPEGTRVTLEYRGAHGFELSDMDDELGATFDEASFPFDARRLDAYGEVFVVVPEGEPRGLGDRHVRLGSPEFPGRVLFRDESGAWTADLDALDGARYLQLRITFAGDVDTGRNAELSAIGLAYSAE